MTIVGRGKNLTSMIMEDLGMAIVVGKYNNGLKFPTEEQLCVQYEVSRSIMREAVKILTAKGLLMARPRQGTRVCDESEWRILDEDVLEWFLKRKLSLPLLREFTEVRLAVEPIAAALAAQNATEADIAKLSRAVRRMEAAENGDDDPLESDIDFHVTLLKISGNRFFNQLKSLSETALKFSIRFTNKRKGVRHADVEIHRLVLEAIENREPEIAKKRVQAMLQEVMDILDE